MFQVESFNSSTHHFAVKFAPLKPQNQLQFRKEILSISWRTWCLSGCLPFFCTYASRLWSIPFNFKCARYGKIHLDDDDCLSCCNYTHAIKWVCIIQRYQERERACKAHNKNNHLSTFHMDQCLIIACTLLWKSPIKFPKVSRCVSKKAFFLIFFAFSPYHSFLFILIIMHFSVDVVVVVFVSFSNHSVNNFFLTKLFTKYKKLH